MASIYDIHIEQGSNFTQRLDSTGDYTGYSISMSIKDSSGAVTSGYVSWNDAATGVFDIALTAVESGALSSGVGHYDIETTSAGGVVDRILQGRIYVDGAVQ